MAHPIRPIIALLNAAALLMGCADTSPAVCRGVSSAIAPTQEVVCARLSAINCAIVDCPGAYRAWQTTVEPVAFARVTACYVAASTCREVDDCARACGSTGPIVPITDASTADVR